MRLAASHPTWALGFEDEVWWSRLARPALHSWVDADQPLRLVEQTVAKTDPDPKALACYGLLVRWTQPAGGWHESTWLRFIRGRPVSARTTEFLAWCCAKLAAAGAPACCGPGPVRSDGVGDNPGGRAAASDFPDESERGTAVPSR